MILNLGVATPQPALRSRKPYASPAMAERRKRIIDCAHVILGEGGAHVLTIERLSREAGVAPRTIYRLFGEKEGVILATVIDRLAEVRNHIARRNNEYDLATALAELDWMVSEMRRDLRYARTVIGFYFSPEPREAAVRELTSVAYNRFRNWLDREIRLGRADTGLDLDRLAHEHVASEWGVYHRWTVHGDDARCRFDLRSVFLKNAAVALAEPARSEHLALLATHQRSFGLSELGARASGNRAARDAGREFIGKP